MVVSSPVKGLTIFINVAVHPNSEPALTIVIVILFAIVSGLGYGMQPEFVAWYGPDEWKDQIKTIISTILSVPSPNSYFTGSRKQSLKRGFLKTE